MIFPALPWRLIGVGAGVAAILFIVWRIYASAYDAGFQVGKAETQAFYRPIIELAEQKAHEAEGRNQALEKASRAINSEMERQHAEFQKTLADRERAFRDRIVLGLRNSATRCHGGPVPETARPASPPSGAPEEHERTGDVIERVAADLTAVAVGCEQDAAAVSDWQQWWRQQQALINPQ